MNPSRADEERCKDNDAHVSQHLVRNTGSSDVGLHHLSLSRCHTSSMIQPHPHIRFIPNKPKSTTYSSPFTLSSAESEARGEPLAPSCGRKANLERPVSQPPRARPMRASVVRRTVAYSCIGDYNMWESMVCIRSHPVPLHPTPLGGCNDRAWVTSRA